jgi:predicted 3-demethylubiquinone-9 3-methyltransferase (glyoxalase superfamily)
VSEPSQASREKTLRKSDNSLQNGSGIGKALKPQTITFNEAILLQVNCDSQEEVDYYWNGLSAGGDPRFQEERVCA